MLRLTPEIIKALDPLLKQMRDGLRSDLMSEIADRFAEYRTNFVKGEGKWCCARMQKVATDVFHVNQSHTGRVFGTTLSILDLPMVYCPFCGVKL